MGERCWSISLSLFWKGYNLYWGFDVVRMQFGLTGRVFKLIGDKNENSLHKMQAV